MSEWTNKLYYGDNLEILRGMDDESVDLIYLDPPFNSNASYNVLFKEKSGEESPAQIRAFEDTWHWDLHTQEIYEEIVTDSPHQVSSLVESLYGFLGPNDMMAYLVMMAIRLVELQRVLTSTGSLYLHCDPTASHYLKLLLDAAFGPRQFRNEIIWRRTGSHGKPRRYAPIHDVILFYTKSNKYKWNFPRKRYMRGHVEKHFERDENGWKTAYYGNVLTGSGTRKGESGKSWRGFDPTTKGRHWAIPGKLLEAVDEDLSQLGVLDKLERLYQLGFIKIKKNHAWPVYEHYIDPNEDGVAAPDIWAYQPYTEGTVFGTDDGIDEDVRWLHPSDQERLSYPTQKPEGILERIIRASSDENDIVLDPFCGCGTSVTIAERLKRRWIGIDLTHLAVSLMRHRLQDTFADELAPYEIIGDPKDVPSAKALAEQDRTEFERWAVGLVDAKPYKLKGSDEGVDGYINFFDDESGKAKRVVVQVKSGDIKPRDIRDLKGVLDREKEPIGIFITLKKPTDEMIKEATSAGFYQPKHFPDQKYPKLQILTIDNLLNGVAPQYPRFRVETFKRAQRKGKESESKDQSLDL